MNLSVWESLEALQAFVYRSAHTDVMQQRRQWFSKMADSYMTLWWIPVGTEPTPAEAIARLDRLRADGPTEAAFTFRQSFPAPSD